MVVGHEFMGDIAEVGRDVHGLEVGQRVAGEGHIGIHDILRTSSVGTGNCESSKMADRAVGIAVPDMGQDSVHVCVESAIHVPEIARVHWIVFGLGHRCASRGP